MITIQNLLDEVRYGKDYIEEKVTVATIQDCFNEDYQLFSVSRRVSNLLEDVDVTKDYVKKILRATRTYKEFENKVFEGENPSKVYMKMKMDSIKEDVNNAIKLFTENKKSYVELDKENVAKSIAALKFGLKTLSEKSIQFSTPSLVKSTSLMENYIEREFSYIEDVIPEQLNS
jgi:hypothetical protein